MKQVQKKEYLNFLKISEVSAWLCLNERAKSCCFYLHNMNGPSIKKSSIED